MINNQQERSKHMEGSIKELVIILLPAIIWIIGVLFFGWDLLLSAGPFALIYTGLSFIIKRD